MNKTILKNRLLFVASDRFTVSIKNEFKHLGKFKEYLADDVLDDTMNLSVKDSQTKVFTHWPTFDMDRADYRETHVNRWLGAGDVSLAMFVVEKFSESKIKIDRESLEILKACKATKTPCVFIDEYDFEHGEIKYLAYMNEMSWIETSIGDSMILDINMQYIHAAKGCNFDTSGQYNLDCAFVARKKISPPLTRKVSASIQHTKVDDLYYKPTTQIVYDPQDDEIILMLGFS